MESVDRRASRRRLMIFAFLAALVSVAGFFGIRQVMRTAHLAQLGERELRLTQVFQTRMMARIRAVLARIRGAELLIGSSPPSAATAKRALVFAMDRRDEGEVHSAAVVLDERARVLASRRKVGIPAPNSVEKDVWSRAVASLRSKIRGSNDLDVRNAFHLEAGTIKGEPVLYLAAPSPSTKGYWGIIFPAENLLSLKRGEIGPNDSLFLLSAPEQMVLYARQGDRFFRDAIGRSFEAVLGPALNILACCESRAFNTLHDSQRWMSQARLSGGTRNLDVVRVADNTHEVTIQTRTEVLISVGLFLGWLVVVVGFIILRSGKRSRGSGIEAPTVEFDSVMSDRLPSNTPFEGLAKISEFVARGDHFRDVIDFGIREAARYIRADRYYSALYDDELDQLFEISCANVGESYRASIAMGSGELPEHIAVKEKDFVEVPSMAEWAGAPESLKKEGVGAVAVFPLRIGEKIVGLMSFYFNEPRELQEEEAEICGFFALQGASAVARALSIADLPPES